MIYVKNFSFTTVLSPKRVRKLGCLRRVVLHCNAEKFSRFALYFPLRQELREESFFGGQSSSPVFQNFVGHKNKYSHLLTQASNNI